jgi:hypothetical protein
MKNFLFFIFSVLSFIPGNGQTKATKQFHIEYKLYSIRYENDSVNSIKGGIVKTDFTGTSDILPLFDSEEHEYGIQFEILESNMNNETRYFLSEAYYYKSGGKWESIALLSPSLIEIKGTPTTDIYDTNGLDSHWEKNFKVQYLYDVTFYSK